MQRIVAGINDGDVMLFPGEMLGQGEAHLTVADDDDLQDSTSFVRNLNGIGMA